MDVNEWNQKAAEITGYTKTEVLGKPFVDTYITEDYKESVQNVLDNAIKGKETATDRVLYLLRKSTKNDFIKCNNKAK